MLIHISSNALVDFHQRHFVCILGRRKGGGGGWRRWLDKWTIWYVNSTSNLFALSFLFSFAIMMIILGMPLVFIVCKCVCMVFMSLLASITCNAPNEFTVAAAVWVVRSKTFCVCFLSFWMYLGEIWENILCLYIVVAVIVLFVDVAAAVIVCFLSSKFIYNDYIHFSYMQIYTYTTIFCFI